MTLKPLITCLLISANADWSSPAHALETASSTYTALSGTACKTVIRNKETGDVTRLCPGIAGYTVLVIDSDDRASITLIAPDKRDFPLKFWDVVAPGFSTLGARAEWRITRKNNQVEPIGIIVRVHTVDQSDVVHPKPISYLAIAKIRTDAVCVTGRVAAEQAHANNQARKVADDASRDCLTQIEAR